MSFVFYRCFESCLSTYFRSFLLKGNHCGLNRHRIIFIIPMEKSVLNTWSVGWTTNTEYVVIDINLHLLLHYAHYFLFSFISTILIWNTQYFFFVFIASKLFLLFLFFTWKLKFKFISLRCIYLLVRFNSPEGIITIFFFSHWIRPFEVISHFKNIVYLILYRKHIIHYI